MLLGPGVLSGNTLPASITQIYRQQVLYGHVAYLSSGLDSSQELLTQTGANEPKERSVAKAAALSLLIPGAGQFYVGDRWRAVPFFLVDVAGWAAYFGFHSQGRNRETEYRAYADQHWNVLGYYAFLDTALGIADSSDFNPTGKHYDSRLQGYPTSEVQLVVDSGFLFSHHVPTRQGEDPLRVGDFNRNFEYYESIGKYDQFFAGWDNLLNRGTYLNMRANANNSFTRAKYGIILSLVDRLASAVDAILAAQRYNKKLGKKEEIEVSLRVIRYNGARMPKLSAVYRF